MSNAKKLAYALIDALNACGIEEEFSYRFLAEMNDLLRKENKKIEMQNQAQALAGNNKELQDGIILLMKEYGLAGGEAYELINRLSNAGNIKALMDDECDEVKSYRKIRASKMQASAPIDEAVQESGTCEEPGGIDDVMQDVYTSGEDPGDTHEPSKRSGTPNYERILKKLDWFLDCKENLNHYSLYNEIKDILKEHQEQNAPIKRSGLNNYDKIIDTVKYLKMVCQEHMESVDLNLDSDVETIIEVIREHQAQNKPVEYGTPKDIGNGEYIAPITGVYDKKEKPQTMPIETLPTYKTHPHKMYADGQTPSLFDVEHEGRAYQEMQFKDFNITFMQGDEVIKSTDIHEALQYVYLLCEGYMAHIDKRRYRMKEILMKQYPSHEVIVKVEEVKAYQ